MTPAELIATYPTLEDLLEHVRALARLGGQDDVDVKSCNIDELIAIAVGAEDAARAADLTWYDSAVKVLALIKPFADAVGSVAGAFTAAAAVPKAL